MQTQMTGGKRVLAVGGGMASGIIHYGRAYGFAGALVEINPQVRAKICERLEVPGYASIEEAVAAHADLIGAYIATPNHTHAELAIKLAPLGIPVFLEKPLGINEEECDRVVKAYAGGKGWIQLDFEYRFSPIYATAQQILASGEVGELRSIHIEYSIGNMRPSAGWRLDPAKTGGLFCENLCHHLDLIRFWSGSEFAELDVKAAPRSMDYYDPRTSDFVVGQFVMENGVFAQLMRTEGSTAVPHDDRDQEPDWTPYGHRLAAYLNTTRGCVRCDIWKRRVEVIRRDPDADMKPTIIRRLDWQYLPFMESHHDMKGMLTDFVRRVANGEGPRLPITDSARTMRAVFACDRLLTQAATKANARFPAKP